MFSACTRPMICSTSDTCKDVKYEIIKTMNEKKEMMTVLHRLKLLSEGMTSFPFIHSHAVHISDLFHKCDTAPFTVRSLSTRAEHFRGYLTINQCIAYLKPDDLFNVSRPYSPEVHLKSKLWLGINNAMFSGQREVISKVIHSIHFPRYREQCAVTQENRLCVFPVWQG